MEKLLWSALVEHQTNEEEDVSRESETPASCSTSVAHGY